MRILRRDRVEPRPTGGGEKDLQKLPEPPEQEREVVAGGGKDGVDGVAPLVGEMVAAHAVLYLDMADHRFDGVTTAHLALDLRRDPTLLTRSEQPELVAQRRRACPRA